MKERTRPSGRRGARAARLYALVLRLYPRAHRRAFGEQMLQTFGDHYRAALETGGESAGRFWLGVLGDEGKSLVREYLAALQERKPSMKKPFFIVLLVAVLLLLGPLLFLPRVARFVFSIVPPPFSLLPLVLVLLAFLAPPLVIMTRFLRTVPQPAAQLTWLRFGLITGAVLCGYDVALYVANAVLPLSAQPPYVGMESALGTVGWAGTLLLVGSAGVIGGYTSGSQWRGAGAVLLASLIAVVVSPLSQVLVIALAWPALQHGTLPSALAMDYRSWLTHQPLNPTLGGFLTAEIFADGLGSLIFTSLFLLVIEGLFALLGSTLGAAAARRVGAPPSLETLPPTSPGRARRVPMRARFILSMLLLSLPMWSLFAVVSLSVTHEQVWISISGTFTSLAFVAWLLVWLLIVVSGLVTARPRSTQPHTFSAEPGG